MNYTVFSIANPKQELQAIRVHLEKPIIPVYEGYNPVLLNLEPLKTSEQLLQLIRAGHTMEFVGEGKEIQRFKDLYELLTADLPEVSWLKKIVL